MPSLTSVPSCLKYFEPSAPFVSFVTFVVPPNLPPQASPPHLHRKDPRYPLAVPQAIIRSDTCFLLCDDGFKDKIKTVTAA